MRERCERDNLVLADFGVVTDTGRSFALLVLMPCGHSISLWLVHEQDIPVGPTLFYGVGGFWH